MGNVYEEKYRVFVKDSNGNEDTLRESNNAIKDYISGQAALNAAITEAADWENDIEVYQKIKHTVTAVIDSV